jgi:FMN-dependent NADH-azoreductase
MSTNTSNILFVTSSLMGENSKSREFGQELVNALRARNANARVVTRDVVPSTIPHITMETLAALATPVADRTAEQAGRVAFADQIIEEVEQADTIVIAAPMYNFSLPSTLKAWIDHIARAGRTFRYTPTGAVGLLENKKVYVALAQGGYNSGPMDFEEPYLRGVLGFLGITDVTFVRIEGLARGPEEAAAGIANAHRQVAALFPNQQRAA